MFQKHGSLATDGSRFEHPPGKGCALVAARYLSTPARQGSNSNHVAAVLGLHVPGRKNPHSEDSFQGASVALLWPAIHSSSVAPSGGEEVSLTTVLVIDDEECICSVIADVLNGAEYRVIGAVDGTTGIECARRLAPDLILLDHIMPGESGVEVLQHLRADPVTAAVPVILMSGMAGNGGLLRAMGAAAYLAKPFSPSELRSAITAVLAPAAVRARAAAA